MCTSKSTRVSLVAIAFTLAACVVDVEPEVGLGFRCDDSGACPPARVCAADGFCRPTGVSLHHSDPPSPSNVFATFTLHGEAPPDTTVSLYEDAACAGPALGQTRSTALGTFTFSASIRLNASRVFYARALEDRGELSACSAGFTLMHDDLPPSTPVLLPIEAAGDRLTIRWEPSTDDRSGIAGYELFLFCRVAACQGSIVRFSADQSPLILSRRLVGSGSSFTLQARDRAGNGSAISNSQIVP